MARVLSLNARAAFNAAQTDEVPVVLVKIEHDDLDEPVRLSSDPTERLSSDPLVYGTVSNTDEYTFVLMSAMIPDDKEGVPPSTQLVFENVAEDMAAVARSVSSPPTVSLFIVLASAPDTIEEQWTGLKATKASYNAGQLTLTVSREHLLNEPWPAYRTTRERFPGLHRW